MTNDGDPCADELLGEDHEGHISVQKCFTGVV